MAILGAHQSIAGGCYRAVERAAAVGCDCVQVFTRSPNQWRSKPIGAEEARRFRSELADRRIGHPLAHDSYLINLASPSDVLWRRSVEAMIDELQRAEMLGIPYVVAHPGAYGTSTEAQGLRRIIAGLDEIDAQTHHLHVGCLLETTAGQGHALGWRFEHLAAILAGARNPDRLGVCFDTCHVFAAGYPLGTRREYLTTMGEFDRIVGLGEIRAFHLNDSLRPRGSRVDRHAHVGRGHMGLEPFRNLLRDRRFRKIPMYLETPKDQEDGVDCHQINLQTLRSLTGKPRD
jgi:deoxyribonuclease-4